MTVRNIGLFVQSEMRRQKLTRHTLAKHSGVTKHPIYRMTYGNGTTLEKTIKILDALGYELDIVKKDE